MTGYEQERVKTLLKEMQIKPHRLRGQNFLVDHHTVEKIIAAVPLQEDDTVIEIGPGLGALSHQLAERCRSVTLIEIEQAFAARLRREFALNERIQIVQADALNFDFNNFNNGRTYRLFANVPYNITTPLLKHLLLAGGGWQSMVLMLQKEAAQRICCGQGRSNGPLTLLTDYCAVSELLFTVPPDAFYPQPDVQSAVIVLHRRIHPPVDVPLDLMLPLIDAGFGERRKMLINSLAASSLKGSRQYWLNALHECGLAETCRAEQLSLADFSMLTRWYLKHSTDNYSDAVAKM